MVLSHVSGIAQFSFPGVTHPCFLVWIFIHAQRTHMRGDIHLANLATPLKRLWRVHTIFHRPLLGRGEMAEQPALGPPLLARSNRVGLIPGGPGFRIPRTFTESYPLSISSSARMV